MWSSLSRREFLNRSAWTMAVGIASLNRSESCGAGNPTDPDPYRGLPMGIQSYSLRNFDVTSAIRQIERLGLRRVELYEGHLALDATPDQVDQLMMLLRSAKIALSGQFVGEFGNDSAANERTFDFLRRAGIRNIVTGTLPASLNGLEHLVKKYDIRVCIHNHGPGSPYDKLGSVQRAIEGRDQRIGACIDTGHVLRSGEDPIAWTHELGDRVYAMHIKDVAEKRNHTENVIIGQGHLDVPELFSALREIEFPSDGSLSMEYEGNPENPFEDIEQCLAVARRTIAQLK